MRSIYQNKSIIFIIFLACLLRFGCLLFTKNVAFYQGLSIAFGTPASCSAKGELLMFDSALRNEIAKYQVQENRLINIEEFQKFSDISTKNMVCDTYETYSLPGYTFLLTLSYLIFQKAIYFPVQVFTLLFDGIFGTFLLFRLARLISKPVSLISAFIYAIGPGFIRLSISALPDSLLSFFILSIISTYFLWIQSSNKYYLIGSAVITGISGYFRPDIIALPVVLFITTWLIKKSFFSSLKFLVVNLALWFIILIPWGLYTYIHTGFFEITRPAIGINLWEGMGEYPNPCNMVLSDEAGAARMAEMGTKWGTVEGDRILLTDSINCIQDNPAFFIASVIFRVPRAFIVKDVVRNNEIETIKYWEQSGTFLGMNEKISLLFFSIIYDKLYEFIFYGFGLIGLIYLFLRNRFTTLILLSPVLSRAIPFSILHVDPRWIIVGQGVVTIFSALGIYILFKFLLIIIKKNISMN